LAGASPSALPPACASSVAADKSRPLTRFGGAVRLDTRPEAAIAAATRTELAAIRAGVRSCRGAAIPLMAPLYVKALLEFVLGPACGMSWVSA